ncbi:hypothetical protein [Limnofasciculus baicalensis]|uniref:Glycosyltransferase family 4 protein n=1 Tax=Limnofasciculus baicalensis BBK-W-15 TaxID=2699891 RepID=A0AAE3KUI9_9CYAN|nr:hypothetical protein [Limnofasciculus baicalensis]MCP2731567.1 hypothetical protein [Limnofasciculus baicalensis BBK-W-15]
MNKASSIFFYEGYVGIAPTIINLSKVLDKENYLTTIYGTENTYAEPGELGQNVQIVYFKKGTRLFDILKKKGFKDIVPLLEFGFYIIPLIRHVFRNKNRKANQRINIGVDIYGSITALFFWFLFRQKFLFLSLELHEPARFKGISSILGSLVKLACQKSEAILIQDEDRFKTFCQYYEYQHPKVFYLPNSTLAAEDSGSDLAGNNYFREKFNLSQDEFPYLLVQAGMIADAVFAKTLAKTFLSIDNGCGLIFHDRQPRQEDPYIQSLRQINSRNLFLSLEPLPYDQIDRIYTSPSIGLAFYADLGNNFTQISMASGKLPQYLKHGKPILVNNLPSLAKLVKQYQIGGVINDPADANEMKSVIEDIINNYDRYSRNAKACFAAEFDFGKKMEPILAFMELCSENTITRRIRAVKETGG